MIHMTVIHHSAGNMGGRDRKLLGSSLTNQPDKHSSKQGTFWKKAEATASSSCCPLTFIFEPQHMCAYAYSHQCVYTYTQISLTHIQKTISCDDDIIQWWDSWLECAKPWAQFSASPKRKQIIKTTEQKKNKNQLTVY